MLERLCSTWPCPAPGKPGSLVPKQDLAVSWKMRTLQRRSPRNKTPIKKQRCLPASVQLRGMCVRVSTCVCTYMCVVLYVGYMSLCMMHVCQQGSKAPVKSKNAQSASRVPLGENQIQVGLDKDPGAIWEANTASDTMYAHPSHTEGG